MLMIQSESIDSQMQMKNECRQNYIYKRIHFKCVYKMKRVQNASYTSIYEAVVCQRFKK